MVNDKMDSVKTFVKANWIRLAAVTGYFLMLALVTYFGCRQKLLDMPLDLSEMCMVENIGIDKNLVVCPDKAYLQYKLERYNFNTGDLLNIRNNACKLSESDQSIRLAIGSSFVKFSYEEARKLCTNNGIDVFNMP